MVDEQCLHSNRGELRTKERLQPYPKSSSGRSREASTHPPLSEASSVGRKERLGIGTAESDNVRFNQPGAPPRTYRAIGRPRPCLTRGVRRSDGEHVNPIRPWLN